VQVATVRRAHAGDLDALVPLFDAYRQFYKQPADLGLARAFLAERLAQDDSVIFIADLDGVTAGFTQLYPTFSSTLAARSYILNDLFVAPHARCHGVGAVLLGAAVAHGRATGAATLRLQTATDNVNAQSLYEAHGWVRDTQFHTYNCKLQD
jgi:GNAT superfamily N-acetyltransferase